MTKQEEILLLRKFPHHYLWNKNRSKWTPEDLRNLEILNEPENAIAFRIAKVKATGQPVIQHKEGQQIEFPSVVVAAIKTGIKKNSIYNCINGHCELAGGFKWEKIN